MDLVFEIIHAQHLGFAVWLEGSFAHFVAESSFSYTGSHSTRFLPKMHRSLQFKPLKPGDYLT
ncbi:MAG: hypothetical protein IJG53_03490, partial [Eggerthellaceae bacterium]|nr:hypothetical protein [Eggerthellaceae bacterium]